MIKRIFALMLSLLMLALCACGGQPADSNLGGTNSPDVPPDAPDRRGEQHRYLTLWSWQIPDPALAEEYAQKAVDCGFTAIDLGVQWSAFEPLKGHFSWTWLDRVVAAFADKGLAVSLQPLLWSKDLSWQEELVFQENKQGVYSEKDRGSFVSFTDGDTLNTVKNTLQNFALHAAGYGETLSRWGVRLSAFGEFDYSVNESLDYSDSAARAFRDYIKESYASAEDVKEAFGLEISSWKDLESIACADLAKSCPLLWRRFRQERLEQMLDLTCGIFRSADPKVPIVFMLGTVGNGMNGTHSGVLDLWSVCKDHDFDILGLSVSDGIAPEILLSYASSLTDKRLCVEVDGAGVWEEGDGEACKAQVKICAAYGVDSIATANFTSAQLTEHRDLLLSYKDLFSSATPAVTAADPTLGILVFSEGVALADPPASFDALYGEVFATLSEQGARKVRFLTETQASAMTSLGEITALYVGNLSGDLPVSETFLQKLKESSAVLYGEGFALVHEDGSPLAEGELPAEKIQKPQ